MQLNELAEKLGGHLSATTSATISGIATLDEAGPKEVSFLTEAKYAARLAQTRAAAVICAEDFTEPPAGVVLLRVPDVNLALVAALRLFAPEEDLPPTGMHPAAVVHPQTQVATSAAVGAGVVVGPDVVVGERSVLCPGCKVGRGVSIGEDCILHANVVVEARCEIGNRVIIHANSTIGADGFGYHFADGRHHKIPHVGIVVIGDDVEIGANSCIDRAKFGRTVIGAGAKIDNLVQIAHNVQVGEHCIVVAQVGVAGSSVLEPYCVLGGQVGVADHVRIGQGAQVGAQSGVHEDVPAGVQVVGSPPRDKRTLFRQLRLIEKLPEMARQLKELVREKNGR